MVRTREEVLAYIDEQLDFVEFSQHAIINLGGWYVDKKKRDESATKHRWHYGRMELSNLVDYLYGDDT